MSSLRSLETNGVDNNIKALPELHLSDTFLVEDFSEYASAAAKQISPAVDTFLSSAGLIRSISDKSLLDIGKSKFTIEWAKEKGYEIVTLYPLETSSEPLIVFRMDFTKQTHEESFTIEIADTENLDSPLGGLLSKRFIYDKEGQFVGEFCTIEIPANALMDVGLNIAPDTSLAITSYVENDTTLLSRTTPLIKGGPNYCISCEFRTEGVMSPDLLVCRADGITDAGLLEFSIHGGQLMFSDETQLRENLLKIMGNYGGVLLDKKLVIKADPLESVEA